MSDQERMDQILRTSMSAGPRPPELSSHFEEKLAARLRPPRRLSGLGRMALAAYTATALALALWTMQAESLEWFVAVPAILVPVIGVAVVRHQVRA
jgi:hypothetical protein